MIVVDSSAWIDFFKDSSTPAAHHLTKLLRGERVLVGDLILCEVLQGARSERHAEQLELSLRRRCEFVSMSDVALATAAAANHRHLRSNGVTVRKTIDVIIGTYCIMHRHSLLHADRDFDPMERYLGLKVVPTHHMVNEPMVAYG
jgi:predicted nucleic acid-binding protein